MAIGAEPSIVARLPLLAADQFDKPDNPLVVNSIRLSVPGLDLFARRDRSAKAGTDHAEKYAWPPRNSCLGPVDEDAPSPLRSCFWERATPFPAFNMFLAVFIPLIGAFE